MDWESEQSLRLVTGERTLESTDVPEVYMVVAVKIKNIAYHYTVFPRAAHDYAEELIV